jgi:hypothetical protein
VRSRTQATKRVAVQSLAEHAATPGGLEALAAEIVDRCKLIHPSKAPAVEALLQQLLERAGRGGQPLPHHSSSGSGSGSGVGGPVHQQQQQQQQQQQHRPQEGPGAQEEGEPLRSSSSSSSGGGGGGTATGRRALGAAQRQRSSLGQLVAEADAALAADDQAAQPAGGGPAGGGGPAVLQVPALLPRQYEAARMEELEQYMVRGRHPCVRPGQGWRLQVECLQQRSSSISARQRAFSPTAARSACCLPFPRLIPPPPPPLPPPRQEALYEEDAAAVALAAGMIAQLFRRAPLLPALLEHGSGCLPAMLARLLREQGRRSAELAANVVAAFCALSAFTQFHPLISQHQVGHLAAGAGSTCLPWHPVRLAHPACVCAEGAPTLVPVESLRTAVCGLGAAAGPVWSPAVGPCPGGQRPRRAARRAQVGLLALELVDLEVRRAAVRAAEDTAAAPAAVVQRAVEAGSGRGPSLSDAWAAAPPGPCPCPCCPTPPLSAPACTPLADCALAGGAAIAVRWCSCSARTGCCTAAWRCCSTWRRTQPRSAR